MRALLPMEGDTGTHRWSPHGNTLGLTEPLKLPVACMLMPHIWWCLPGSLPATHPWDCCRPPGFRVTALACFHRVSPTPCWRAVYLTQGYLCLAPGTLRLQPEGPPRPLCITDASYWPSCGLDLETLDAPSPREAHGQQGHCQGHWSTWRSVTGAEPGWPTAEPEVPARTPTPVPSLS